MPNVYMREKFSGYCLLPQDTDSFRVLSKGLKRVLEAKGIINCIPQDAIGFHRREDQTHRQS